MVDVTLGPAFVLDWLSVATFVKSDVVNVLSLQQVSLVKDPKYFFKHILKSKVQLERMKSSHRTTLPNLSKLSILSCYVQKSYIKYFICLPFLIAFSNFLIGSSLSFLLFLFDLSSMTIILNGWSWAFLLHLCVCNRLNKHIICFHVYFFLISVINKWLNNSILIVNLC